MPDPKAEAGLRDLPATVHGTIGSYVGVPLQLSDGRVYGTFCCAGAETHEPFDERDVRFMRVLARVIADRIERMGEAPATTPSRPDDEDVEMRVDLWFAASPHAIQATRAALDTLGQHLEARLLGDARLLVSELVTNSVLHSGAGAETSMGLSLLLCKDRLQVTVADQGVGFDPAAVPPPDPERVGGWGLYLVNKLSRRWGVGAAPDNSAAPNMLEEASNRVWFELPRDEQGVTAG